jgi:hypothetical protein
VRVPVQLRLGDVGGALEGEQLAGVRGTGRLEAEVGHGSTLPRGSGAAGSGGSTVRPTASGRRLSVAPLMSAAVGRWNRRRAGKAVAGPRQHGRMTRQRAQQWKLWSGCCEPFVLWDPNGDGIPVDEAPVSDALKDELRSWQDFVEEHVGADGWDSDEAQALHVRRARGLQKWLRGELGEAVDLDVSAVRVGW